MNSIFIGVLCTLIALVTALWKRMKSAEERLNDIEKKMGAFWQQDSTNQRS